MPKFKEHFQCGSGEISTVNSIQMGVTFASGEYNNKHQDSLFVMFRSPGKFSYQPSWLETDHSHWVCTGLCWVCSQCRGTKHLPSLLQCWCLDRAGPGHHLLASSGLHHPVLWQEETFCYRDCYLWVWYWDLLICSFNWMVCMIPHVSIS